MTVERATVTVTGTHAAFDPESEPPVMAAAETPPAAEEAIATVTYLVDVLVPVRVVVVSDSVETASASFCPAGLVA